MQVIPAPPISKIDAGCACDRQWSADGGGGPAAAAAAAREEAELQEAIQLSLAMEESRRQHEIERQREALDAAKQTVRPCRESYLSQLRLYP